MLSDIKLNHNTNINIPYSGHNELKESYNSLIYYLLINSSSTLNQLFSDKLSYKYPELEITSGILNVAVQCSINEVFRLKIKLNIVK